MANGCALTSHVLVLLDEQLRGIVTKLWKYFGLCISDIVSEKNR